MTATASRMSPAHPPFGVRASIVDLYSELERRQPHLATATLLSIFAILPCLLAMALDPRMINGVNVWIKPTKFLLSFTVYYATLAWVFGYLGPNAQASRSGRFVIWAALLAGLYEMVWLVLAAVFGVPAHFNYASVWWSVAYAVAGVGSTLLVTAILVQGIMVARQRDIAIAPGLRWSLVLGSVIAFTATLVTAGYMSAGSGHWVGGANSDAGGLPLMGWSRVGGDLRVAHFWALHAQQIMPIIGALLVAAGVPRVRAWVVLAAIAYTGLIAFTFLQALYGIPSLPALGK
ncbi:MAG: hypothetical protein ACKVQT_07380 [Burkholderiales bacterium]